jgi:hypothetical protein
MSGRAIHILASAYALGATSGSSWNFALGTAHQRMIRTPATL